MALSLGGGWARCPVSPPPARTLTSPITWLYPALVENVGVSSLDLPRFGSGDQSVGSGASRWRTGFSRVERELSLRTCDVRGHRGRRPRGPWGVRGLQSSPVAWVQGRCHVIISFLCEHTTFTRDPFLGRLSPALHEIGWALLLQDGEHADDRRPREGEPRCPPPRKQPPHAAP